MFLNNDEYEANWRYRKQVIEHIRYRRILQTQCREMLRFEPSEPTLRRRWLTDYVAIVDEMHYETRLIDRAVGREVWYKGLG